jgi:protein SCO1/2
MRFLLGPTGELQRQWRAYGIQRQSERLEHSAYVVLLDGQGRQRIGFPAGQVTPDALANDLRLLERE